MVFGNGVVHTVLVQNPLEIRMPVFSISMLVAPWSCRSSCLTLCLPTGLPCTLPARHCKNLRAAARIVRPVSLVVLMAKLIVLFSTSSCMGFTVLSSLHQSCDEKAEPGARRKKYRARPHGQSSRMAIKLSPPCIRMTLCSSRNSAS